MTTQFHVNETAIQAAAIIAAGELVAVRGPGHAQPELVATFARQIMEELAKSPSKAAKSEQIKVVEQR